MSRADYIVGAAWWASTTAAVAGAAWLVVRARLSHLWPVARAVALAVVFLTGLVAVHVIPGALGLLTRPAVLLLALVVLAGATRVRPVRREPEPEPEPVAADSAASWVLAATGVLALAGFVVAAASERVTHHVDHIDMATWDLPMIAQWMQSRSLWGVHEFVPLFTHGSYPHNGDVVLLSAMLPWQSDFAVRWVAYAMLALAGLALYHLARELRAPRAAAALLAAALLAMPAVTVTALDYAMPDTLLIPAFAAGVAFLVRHVRTGARSDLVLAGLALGLAFGSKWYGVSAVAVTALVWAGARLAARRPAGDVAREGGILVGVVLAVGGFWLLRDLVSYGDPLYPVRVPLLFDPPPDPLRARLGFTLAHYLGDPSVLRHAVLPQLRSSLGLSALIAMVAALATMVAGALRLRRAPGRREAIRLAIAVAALLVAAAYAVTPYSALGPAGDPLLLAANARYAVPAVVLGLALAASVAVRRPALRLGIEVLALAAVAQGLHNGPAVSAGRTVAAAAGLAAIAAVTVVARRTAPRWAIAPGLAGLLVVAGAGGWVAQRRFADGRYANTDPVFSWIQARAPQDARIGVAGAWTDRGISPVLPAFGPRLRNRVDYVGAVREGQLRRLPAGRWVHEVRGDDLLLVGRAQAGRDPDERRAQRAGLRTVATSDRLVLFAVPRRAGSSG